MNKYVLMEGNFPLPSQTFCCERINLVILFLSFYFIQFASHNKGIRLTWEGSNGKRIGVFGMPGIWHSSQLPCTSTTFH